MEKKYDIFISYRREGGYDTAKHLNDLLVREGYKVSFDIDTLRSGDFDTQLLTRIDQCKDFILIVDAHAFDRTLNPNFDPKKDWVRQELAYALKKGKNIIPVLLSEVKGFPQNLPIDIAAVSKKNGPEYSRYYFNDFYAKLKKEFLTSKRKWISSRVIIAVCIIIMAFVTLIELIDPFPPKVQPDKSDNNASTFVRHFKYRGIPIDKNIQDFADKLYPQGFVLESKDYDNHRYTFYKEEEHNKVIVEWDEVTGNVFMVYDIQVGTTPGTNTLHNMADLGFGKVGRFDDSHDCVEGENGLIIFTDGDYDGNECLIFVDSLNSKGYELVNI